MNDTDSKKTSAFDKGLERLDEKLKADIEEAINDFTRQVQSTLEELRQGFDERKE